MAEITVPLIHGLKIGEIVHREAVLRELTVADLIEAGAAAERVVEAGGRAQLAQSPTLAGIEMLCRQVIRIGDHPGPLTRGEIMRLHVDDFLLLQHMAEGLDQAAARAVEEAAARGRGD